MRKDNSIKIFIQSILVITLIAVIALFYTKPQTLSQITAAYEKGELLASGGELIVKALKKPFTIVEDTIFNLNDFLRHWRLRSVIKENGYLKQDARKIAREADHLWNTDPGANRDTVFAKLEIAEALDPDEAYIYLTFARISMAYGHIEGPAYEEDSYAPDYLDRAVQNARQAMELDPSLIEAHLFMSRLAVIKRDFAEARRRLDHARTLDPFDLFVYWYCEGVLAHYSNSLVQAEIYYAEAEKKIATPYHENWLGNRLIALAQDRDPITQ